MIHPAYIAGFFDGEGCVNITVRGKIRQVRLRLMIVNTHLELLKILQAQYGGGLQKLTRQENWKQAWQLTIHSKDDQKRFIEDILPYSILKLPQLYLALEFLEFMDLPKTVRCTFEHKPVPGMPSRIIAKRREDTMKKELEFKARLNAMNRRGISPN